MSRYCLIPDAKRWPELFGVSPESLPKSYRSARYNLTRGATAPVLVRNAKGGRELVLMQWGFLPRSVKCADPPLEPITVPKKKLDNPYFKDSLAARRCLVPYTGFFTWHGWERGPGLPYFVRRKDGEPFLVAGFWDENRGVKRFAIITVKSSELLSTVYDRMPALIPNEDAERWLAGDDYRKLLKSCDSVEWDMYRVGSGVFDEGADSPDLIIPR